MRNIDSSNLPLVPSVSRTGKPRIALLMLRCESSIQENGDGAPDTIKHDPNQASSLGDRKVLAI